MIEGTVITNIGNDNFNPTAFDFSFGIIGLQFKDGQIIHLTFT